MMSSFNSASVFDLDTPSPSPFSRRRGWLAASIALNLVLVGLICAWILGMRSHAAPNGTWQREIISSLSASDVTIVERGIKGIADAKAAGDLTIQSQHDLFHDTLKTDPMNKILLQQRMNDIAKSRFDQAVAINQSFFEELTNLSPDGRFKIEAEMERMWNHPRQPPR